MGLTIFISACIKFKKKNDFLQAFENLSTVLFVLNLNLVLTFIVKMNWSIKIFSKGTINCRSFKFDHQGQDDKTRRFQYIEHI